MLFNSIPFLIFFPIVVGIYFLLPQKWKQLWLLLASYYFYMSWNAAYALLIFGVTFLSYLGGRGIGAFDGESAPEQGKKRAWCLGICVSVVFFLLFLFKYLDFALGNISKILKIAGVTLEWKGVSLLLPVGISFYTFQAVGYLVDVYRGETKAEKSFLRYALFVSFFPQLVAGPIERSGNLLRQLETPKPFDYDMAKNGLLLMLWGFFEKIWIADQAAILVNTVYEQYENYSAAMLVFATILFGIQIYCDFGGYSHIAIGAAQVLGIRLMDNFRQPYLAESVKEFWRRWHISLSGWFRDYLYIPLGGSRRGKTATYRNLMVTFLVSGLWHGASWNYVFWGALHGVYQIAGSVTQPFREAIRKKFFIRKEPLICKGIRILVTFLFCDFAWLFFRAPSLSYGISMIRHGLGNLFHPYLNRNIFSLGLEGMQLLELGIAILLLAVVDVLHERGYRLRSLVGKLPVVLRWSGYLSVLTAFVLFLIQNYGKAAASFIYFQF